LSNGKEIGMDLFPILAMGPAQPGQEQAPGYVQMLPLLAIFFVFYFLLIRPQAKKQKQHEEMLSQLKKGDKVVTTGGIYGKISAVKDEIIVLSVGDNVKLEVAKSAVSRVAE